MNQNQEKILEYCYKKSLDEVAYSIPIKDISNSQPFKKTSVRTLLRDLKDLQNKEFVKLEGNFPVEDLDFVYINPTIKGLTFWEEKTPELEPFFTELIIKFLNFVREVELDEIELKQGKGSQYGYLPFSDIYRLLDERSRDHIIFIQQQSDKCFTQHIGYSNETGLIFYGENEPFLTIEGANFLKKSINIGDIPNHDKELLKLEDEEVLKLNEIPFRAYTGEKDYIFVAYSHDNKHLVYPEINWINNKGYNIWYDEGIPPTSEWPKVIQNKIENCSLFLVFITPNAVESKYVRREVALAVEKDKEILPIILEKTNLVHGLGFQLTINEQLLKYEGSEESYKKKLLETLESHLNTLRKPQNEEEQNLINNRDEIKNNINTILECLEQWKVDPLRENDASYHKLHEILNHNYFRKKELTRKEFCVLKKVIKSIYYQMTEHNIFFNPDLINLLYLMIKTPVLFTIIKEKFQKLLENKYEDAKTNESLIKVLYEFGFFGTWSEAFELSIEEVNITLFRYLYDDFFIQGKNQKFRKQKRSLITDLKALRDQAEQLDQDSNTREMIRKIERLRRYLLELI